MDYIRTPDGDQIDVFHLCQAHQQLESDYNVGGWLRQRPSNQRRRESTSCQLARLGFSNPYGWVDIENPDNDAGPDDEEVRAIYLQLVIKYQLPTSPGLRAQCRRVFVHDWLRSEAPWMMEN